MLLLDLYQSMQLRKGINIVLHLLGIYTYNLVSYLVVHAKESIKAIQSVINNRSKGSYLGI
jgi:hypothetical protein